MSPRRGEVLLGRWRPLSVQRAQVEHRRADRPERTGALRSLSIRGAPHQDRPDRAFKTRELALLIEFYLERAERYGAISQEAADEARYFVHTLDDGYELTFTRSALIFDFAKPGTGAARERRRNRVTTALGVLNLIRPASGRRRAEHGVVVRDWRAVPRMTRAREVSLKSTTS